MEVIELVKLGTPFLVLGMLVVLERIDTNVKDIREDVQELKQDITGKDTCNARHEEINRRFDRVESDLSGGIN